MGAGEGSGPGGVEPEPVSGAWLWHAPVPRHKSRQMAAVPVNCHRRLGADEVLELRLDSGPRPAAGIWVCGAGPPVIMQSSYADQFTPASSGWTTPQEAQEIWPLAWMVQTSRTVLSVRYSVDVQVAGEPALNCSTM